MKWKAGGSTTIKGSRQNIISQNESDNRPAVPDSPIRDSANANMFYIKIGFMKKSVCLRQCIFLVTLLALVFSSCQKERGERRRAFKASYDTWYRVSPSAPQPLLIQGQTYLGILHFPGGGTGHATHLGQSSNYFNQLAYIQPQGQGILGSVAAPLTQIPAYPVAGDFSQFIPFLSSYAIPEKTGEHIINSVMYNGKGDALFLTALTGSGGTVPISETRINFNGKGLILGGRGKFEKAVGEYDYSGYFNPENTDDASYEAEGWIDF